MSASPRDLREMLDGYDAVVLTGGAEAPRDLPIPGRDLAGMHFAMAFLVQQNRRVGGEPSSGDGRSSPPANMSS